MNNFLSTSISLLPNVKNKSLNWIGDVIKFIVERPFWSVGIGIILFTLILKFITMPFDVFSRVASKSNSLKMEKMRPELQRLQKQYANNKQLYQQKVMALQKKSGYSPFSACLPSIIAIIIFIVVINAFNDYSTYANRKLVNKMIDSYNLTLIENKEVIETVNASGEKEYNLNIESQGYKDWVIENYGYYTADGDDFSTTEIEKLYNDLKKSDYLYDKEFEDKKYTEYFKVNETDGTHFIVGETQDRINLLNKTMSTNFVQNKIPEIYIQEVIKYSSQSSAKDTFNKEVNDFLWIKNIWVADSMLKRPLEGKSAYGMNTSSYNELTAQMKSEKNAKNGYFIFVVLSVGVMVLSQLVGRKEQKTQMELQSVEGKNSTMSQTQKVMMVVMPLMYGIFAFIYTAAFSLYMIISSLFSMISTLIINLVVTKIFAKKLLKEQKEKENSRFKFRR